MGGIDVVAVVVASAEPLGVVAATYVDAETDGLFGCGACCLACFLLLFHPLGDALRVLRVDGEEVADLVAVFQEEVVPPRIPPADDDVAMREHLLFQCRNIAVSMFEAGCRQQSQRGEPLGADVEGEADEGGVANLEVRVFVAETHGHDAAAMFTRPGIDMCKLQQVVAHLTFISCEQHRRRMGELTN